MKKFLILIVVIFSGCELKMANPPITNYTLSLTNIEPKKNISSEILKFPLPMSDKIIMSNNILYDENNSTLESYAFAKWVDTPNAMIQKILKETIIQSNLFKSVILDYSSLRGDLELESNIIEFKQLIDKTQSFGILKMRFFLIDSKSKDLIASKEFDYKIKSNQINILGAVDSINLATKNLAKDLIEWLEVVSK